MNRAELSQVIKKSTKILGRGFSKVNCFRPKIDYPDNLSLLRNDATAETTSDISNAPPQPKIKNDLNAPTVLNGVASNPHHDEESSSPKVDKDSDTSSSFQGLFCPPPAPSDFYASDDTVESSQPNNNNGSVNFPKTSNAVSHEVATVPSNTVVPPIGRSPRKIYLPLGPVPDSSVSSLDSSLLNSIYDDNVTITGEDEEESDEGSVILCDMCQLPHIEASLHNVVYHHDYNTICQNCLDFFLANGIMQEHNVIVEESSDL